MIIQRLESYNRIETDISIYREELDRLRQKSLTGEISTSPSGGHGISDPTSALSIKAADIELMLKRRIEELELERLNILEELDKMGTCDIKQILYYHYVDRQSWSGVAKSMGEGYTKDAVRMAHSRFLKKSK